jgi:hypothetical protein
MISTYNDDTHLWAAFEKRDENYWPQYVEARVAKWEKFRYDTISTGMTALITNNISWEIFRHSVDKTNV